MGLDFVNKLKNKSVNMYGQKPVTIAFLGDSVTQGCFEIYKTGEKSIETVFDSENSYSVKLKKLFTGIYPNVQLNIINSGISGDNSANGLKRIERDILPYSPDLVVVCFGLNDCNNGQNYIETYADNLKKIFKKLKSADIEIIFMTPNMMNTKTSCNITDIFIKEIAERLAAIQNNGILKKYIDAAKAAAVSEGVKVCDCYDKWEKLYQSGVDTTSLLANYLNHPAREMHWLFAYSLFETIMFN